jgi:hypothetical protein
MWSVKRERQYHALVELDRFGVVHARTKGIEDGVLGGVTYSQDEWEAEFVLVLGVEGVEAVHLLLG